jgi:lipopolysaccharide/colanic/teichoic acid biosynthesis glycosyltransferase
LAENVVDRLVSTTEITAPTPTVVSRQLPHGYLVVKDLLDVLLSSALIVLLLPLFVAIMIWIRLDSAGPALFRQQRIGRRGEVFTILKFRTMVTRAPAYSYKVGISDARITRAGRVLRRSGLDELPQLWNVLLGDMSLVGPRPELPFIVEQYQGWNHARHSVRPGITGWWQIHHRNDVPMHLNLEYDCYYVEHISPALDWQIIRTTVGLTVRGLAKGR